MYKNQQQFENFSVIQQQLIDARDKLDMQVMRLTRIHAFTAKALYCKEESEFAVAVADAIIDIFEFEYGVCWTFEPATQRIENTSVLGLQLSDQQLSSLADSLIHANDSAAANPTISDNLALQLKPYLAIDGGCVSLCKDADGNLIALILGGNSYQSAGFFQDLTAELNQSFSLFASQLGSILEMQRGRSMIQSLHQELSVILQAVPDLLFELDENGQYLNIWAHDESLLAKEKTLLIGRTVSEILHKQAAQTVLEALQEAKTHDCSYGKSIWLDLDGEVRWFELSVARKKDKSAQQKFILLSRDITDRKSAQQKLTESEARFKKLFEKTDAISVQGYDNKRRVIYWNAASERLYGISAEQALGKPLEDLIIPDEMREAVIDAVNNWIANDVAIPSSELTLKKGDGSLVNVFSSHVMLKNISGAPEMFCLDVDLTQQKQALEQVQLLSMAVEQSPVSVVITDAAGDIEYVNNSFERISGYAAHEVIGQNPRLLQSGRTQKKVYQELWSCITNGKAWHGQLQNKRKDGQIIWENVHIAPVMNQQGAVHHYLAVKEDISLQKEQEQTILQQAHFDSLTKLPNRFLCLDRLSQSIIDAQRNDEKVAVIFIDLDDFKKINDSMGHDVGDLLLIDAATRLRSAVRTGDTVGRLGGDEFLVILGSLREVKDIRPVAETMLTNFRQAFSVANRDIILTLSAGVAIYPVDGATPAELLKNADSAMYFAKGQGRNTYSFFTESMNKDILRRLHLEEQMQGALDRNEFMVVYQPQCSISNNRIDGAEALLRWHNPELGSVPADEFIQIAEQTGIIIQLGNFVLTEALKTAKQWLSIDPAFKIAVNLSPRQFRDPALVDNIINALVSTGFPGKQLELEITEGVLMSGHSYIHQALDKLSEIGVIISMDDFGTGYSSLSYLRSYPFNVLKIDRSFIRDIDVDRADLELVNAAIAMGHGLGLEIVAEGVEHQKQLDLLSKLNCDIAQGYLFSKPVGAEKLTEMLNRHFV